VHLADAPSYEALSYVWGTAPATSSINCNRSSISITPTLQAALKSLRDASEPPIIFWVDQICINQEDVTERSQQVNMMKTIFSQAKCVIMWLGHDPDGDAPLVNDLFRQFVTSNPNRFPENAFADDKVLQALNLPIRESPMWKAMGNFLKLPYFSRIWIVQEVRLAKSIVMIWDSCQLDWEIATIFLRWIDRGMSDSWTNPGGLASLLDPRALIQAVALTYGQTHLKT
jgi:hypothetical protein